MPPSLPLPPPESVLAADDARILYGSHEEARLRVGGRDLHVGDHYGDPRCGVIDWTGRWCVTGGYGLVVCDMAGLEAAGAAAVPEMFWRRVLHFADGSEIWPVAMAQVADRTVRFVHDLASPQVGIYDLDVATLAVKRLGQT